MFNFASVVAACLNRLAAGQRSVAIFLTASVITLEMKKPRFAFPPVADEQLYVLADRLRNSAKSKFG